MIRISFYLNSPKAKQSPVYISITKDKDRNRFPSGVTFLTNHVTNRTKKGKSFLIKGMPHYFSYQKILHDIEEEITNYALKFEFANEPYSISDLKNKFQEKRNINKHSALSFFDCYNKFVAFNSGQWTSGTQNHFQTLKNHLEEYEKDHLKEKIKMDDLDETFYCKFRDDYFVGFKKLGNSTSNNYLKKFKQFCEYAAKKEWITKKVHFDEFKRLTEAETFHVALKKSELDKIINLDFSNNARLDRVRDLFLLEIYTGQRFSDIPQVLDLSDDVEESINIYQKKTFGKAFIPIHSTLKNHLKNIKDKNYTEITSISLQKFNDYLKEIAQLAEMNRKHKWKILVGKEQISKEEFRYNLITSHTGRRTFCTLALKNGIDRETIMKVTGHKTYEQFRKYVKVDEEDMDDAFENFLTK